MALPKFTDPKTPGREFQAANKVEATRFRAMGYKEVKPKNKARTAEHNKAEDKK